MGSRLQRAPESFLDPQQIAAVQGGRREFLRGAFAAAVAATAATPAARAEPAGDSAILELPEHSRSLGQPVAARP
jgi:sulfane dehydrogenase subunit SoxC